MEKAINTPYSKFFALMSAITLKIIYRVFALMMAFLLLYVA